MEHRSPLTPSGSPKVNKCFWAEQVNTGTLCGKNKEVFKLEDIKKYTQRNMPGMDALSDYNDGYYTANLTGNYQVNKNFIL